MLKLHTLMHRIVAQLTVIFVWLVLIVAGRSKH